MGVAMTSTTVRHKAGGKKTRDRQRLTHLITGVALIAYVYQPGGPSPLLRAAVQWVILPALVLAGVLMWQWPKIRRWNRTRATGS